MNFDDVPLPEPGPSTPVVERLASLREVVRSADSPVEQKRTSVGTFGRGDSAPERQPLTSISSGYTIPRVSVPSVGSLDGDVFSTVPRMPRKSVDYASKFGILQEGRSSTPIYKFLPRIDLEKQQRDPILELSREVRSESWQFIDSPLEESVFPSQFFNGNETISSRAL